MAQDDTEFPPKNPADGSNTGSAAPYTAQPGTTTAYNQQPGTQNPYGAPANGTQAYGAPAGGAAGYGAQPYGAPAGAAPGYGAPTYGAPAYGAQTPMAAPNAAYAVAPNNVKTINKHVFVWVMTFLVGGLGVDRFVRGQIGMGVLKLLVGWLTFGIWWLVDWIIAMVKAYGEAFSNQEELVFINGKYAR